jgi:hypothetical protein
MLHIRNFRVGSFRGLDDVTLSRLARVNLIVGGNNQGKTTILEALGVFAAPSNLVERASIARMREVRSPGLRMADSLSSIEAVRWMFPQREETGEVGAAKSYGRFTFVNRSHSMDVPQREETGEVGAAKSCGWTVMANGTSVRSRQRVKAIRGNSPEPQLRMSLTTNIEIDDPTEEQGWHISGTVAVDPTLNRDLLS